MTLSWDVLIPAYNAGGTIGAAVASALAAEPRPAQVLVYDDGSSDDTVARAREAGAEVVVGTWNRGVGHARQQLLARARAPWFLVLDADDQLLPGAGRLLQQAVDASPDAWVIGLGEVPDTVAPPAGPAPLDPALPVDLRSLWRRNPFISSSTLVRREPAVAIGGFPAVRRLVDYAFWLRLAAEPDARGRLWNHTAPLTARALNAGTITGNVVGAVLAERTLLLQHAEAALSGSPALVGRARVTARLSMLWWRGLSRHTDYGKPASSYLTPVDVVPGRLVPRLLGVLASGAVQRSLRWAAARVRRALRPADPVAAPAVAVLTP
jgi:glycosyltransferase involved in cell wall biosynthesis